MKTLLILLICFASIYSNGQDIIWHRGDSNGISYTIGRHMPVFDTVSVIMLVSDTAVYESSFSTTISCKEAGCDGKHSALWVHSRQIITPYGSRQTVSIVGYEVHELYLLDKIWTHKEYLNEKKRPLDKNIIVWLSIKH